jgi:multicomponent Na+:H+ antiporter subunit G
MTTIDVITAVLVLTGGLSCLLGALGLVRFPDVPSRLQAATKPQTLGLILILVGTAIRLEFESAATLLLIVLFQLLTAPVISQIVGRSAYRAGTLRRDDLIVDELADPMARSDAPPGPGRDERPS